MNVISVKKKYVLDTNILMGFSRWLPITLNTFFWSNLENSLRNRDWVLLDVIVDEVLYDNDLVKWCKQQRRNGLVTILSSDERNRAVDINSQYPMINQSNQNSTVDTYLVAHAEAHGLTIFSQESNRLTTADLYKIPDACAALNIQNIRKPVNFLKDIGFRN